MYRYRHVRQFRRTAAAKWLSSALLATLLLVLLTALRPLLQAAAKQRPESDSPDFAAIEAYIESTMRSIRLPGLALAIVHNDEIVHMRGYGRADASGRAVTPQTPFLIASVTKQLTALAIMQLVEKGQLELDAPVQRYLPSFRVADAEAARQITVRQLLNHTSGLPTLTEDDGMIFDLTLGDRALAARVAALRDTALTAAPGTRYQYSNAGYATLALIIEAITGQVYADYLQQQIYDPLEMNNSFVSKAEAQRHGLARGYRYWFSIPLEHDWSYSPVELGAGFTYSSAEDLAHYLIAQLDEGRYGDSRILSPASLVEMRQPSASVYESEAYGFGWLIRQKDGVQIVSHAGVAPNYYADLVLLPETGWGYVLLMNATDSLRQERMTHISNSVARLLLGAEPPPPPSTNILTTLFTYVLVGSGLGLVGMLRSVVLLRRWHRQPQSRPRGWLRVGLHVVPPLLISLLWGYVTLVGVPQLLIWPLADLRFKVPDFGYTLIISGLTVIAWGVLRLLLVLRILREPVSTRRSALG